MDYEAEQKRIVDEARERQKAKTQSDLGNTMGTAAIGAGLALWAYGTLAHTVLFGFLFFSVCVVSNAVIGEMRNLRLASEIRELRWRQDERLDVDIEAGRVRRQAFESQDR